MSGDWIKMRVNLWDDPRVGRICDLTGAKEAAVIGSLYWLWTTADQHSADGSLPGLSMQQIDRKTGLRGFAAALVAIGWLADHPEGVIVVHFDEHNGASAKKRAETARRVANHRAANAPETREYANGNAESVTGALARARDREEKKEIPPSAAGASADGSLVQTAPKSKRRTRTPGAMPLPEDWKPSEADVSKLARELSIAPGVVARNYVDGFRDLCLSRGYLYRDFDAAFRNCVRQDWPAIRKANGRPQTSAMDEVFGGAH